MKYDKYEPHVCGECSQTKDYALPMDPGGALIVLAVANAVKRLERNRVHLQKEMECDPKDFGGIIAAARAGFMSSRMEGNASRPRYHGLIAHVEEGSGEYLITRKGAAFLKGASIARVAIIDKVHHHNVGYWNESSDRITFRELAFKSNREPLSFWNLEETVREVERIGHMVNDMQLSLV